MTESCQSGFLLMFVRNNIIQEIRDREIHRNMEIWTTLDCVSTAADNRSRHNNSTDRHQPQISERKSKDSNRSEQNKIPTATATKGVPTGKMTFSYWSHSSSSISAADFTMSVGLSLDPLGGSAYASRGGDSSTREGNRRDLLIGAAMSPPYCDSAWSPIRFAGLGAWLYEPAPDGRGGQGWMSRLNGFRRRGGQQ